jgi:protein-S-isoprenylcysteine O-methyltransferase Ste14
VSTATDAAAVRFPPPLIFLGFLLLGFLVDRLLDLPPLPLPWWIGALIALAGAALEVVAFGLLRGVGEDPKPWVTTNQIVQSGIYARTRNPMYLGMATIQFGLALAFGTVTGALFTFVACGVVGATVIAREEAYLTAKFGAPYRAYMAKVRRWF